MRKIGIIGKPELGLTGLQEQVLLQRTRYQKALSGIGNAAQAKTPQTKTPQTKNPQVATFKENILKYNEGISKEEMQAWVYYKRTFHKVPMTGWEDYYIHNNSQQAIAKLVKAGALFYNGNDEYLPFAAYCYGNMYDRELELRKNETDIVAKYGETVFEAHLMAIKNAKPTPLTVTNPDKNERPIISAISEFAHNIDKFSISTVREEYLTIEKADQLKAVNGQVTRKANKDKIIITLDSNKDYCLQDVFISYLYALKTSDFKDVQAYQIVDYYLLGRSLRDDSLAPDEKAAVKADARIEGEAHFSTFLNEVLTFEDQQKLDVAWNRTYNGQSSLVVGKIPIGFSCSALFKSFPLVITPAQREGVAFMEVLGSGINAFDVGVGKTMTAIITLASQLQSGKCSRPFIVVPKPTFRKWVREIKGYTDKDGNLVSGVLTGTGIEVNEWGNLGTDIVKRINLNQAVKKGTITLLTYEGFKKIGFGKTVAADLKTELINILAQSKTKNKKVRDAEVDYLKYEEMVGTGNKNTIADIDVLGLDYAVIDEAHRCKNVFAMVGSDEDGKKRYSMTSASSETGLKAFLLLNYIQRKFGRNTMLLTATPFTNSPLEIYSMMSLVAQEQMEKMGISDVHTFFNLFVLPTTEWAANYKEEVVEKEVIKSFTNRLVLQKLIYNHILYKTGEEAGVKRPVKVNIPMLYDVIGGTKARLGLNEQVLTYIKMSVRQRDNQTAITNNFKVATKGKLDKALMFRMLARSLDNALSPFLVNGTPSDYKDFVESSPKILYAVECIASVKKYHEAHSEPVSGQVIYSNRGKDFFPFIKEYLEKEVGYKKGVTFEKGRLDEVEIISSDISEHKKENIKEAFLQGIVKVIIGTATIREGIDLQNKGTVIYNLYPEWNPTDIRQLEGRIWRQGNEFEFVRIVMPLIQDSMDVFVAQKLEEKTARINDIWFRADRGNVLDLESLDPNEIKLALITDSSRIVRIVFDEKLQEAERAAKRAVDEFDTLSDIEWHLKNYKKQKADVVQLFKDAVFPFFERMVENAKNLLKSEKEKVGTITVETKKDAEKILATQDWIIQTGIAEISINDKHLLKVYAVYKGIHENQRQTPRGAWTIDNFKEYLSIVKKTERTTLIPRGYTIDSDLTQVTQDLYDEAINKIRFLLLFKSESIAKRTNDRIQTIAVSSKKGEDLDKLTIDLIRTVGTNAGEESSTKWLEIAYTVKEKKALYNVDGKTAPERAKEFEKLNYLLSKKVISTQATSPQTTKPTKNPNSGSINILSLAAKAKLKKLRLIAKLKTA